MNKPVEIALGLGSNLGCRRTNILKAVELLEGYGVRGIRISSLAASEPVDCPEGSGEFLNGALTGIWDDSPVSLLNVCHEVEKELGRPQVRSVNSPRTVDLDILLFGSEVVREAGLSVPHKRMLERDFVMKPLAEVAGEWVIPETGKKVKELAGEFD